MKKLYRSRKHRLMAGICGGFGEYFNIDPVIFRLLFLFIIMLAGWPLVLYIIAWIIVPKKPYLLRDIETKEEIKNK